MNMRGKMKPNSIKGRLTYDWSENYKKGTFVVMTLSCYDELKSILGTENIFLDNSAIVNEAEKILNIDSIAHLKDIYPEFQQRKYWKDIKLELLEIAKFEIVDIQKKIKDIACRLTTDLDRKLLKVYLDAEMSRKEIPRNTIQLLKAEIKKLEKVNKTKFVYSDDPIKQQISEYIATRERSKLTELLTNKFMEYNHIYTTKNDSKPELWIYSDGIYVPNGKSYIQEFCRELLCEDYKHYIASEVINKICADTFIEEDDFFNTNYVNIIPVKNGLLDLINNQLLEFDPKMIFFSKLPVFFNPRAKCPKIKKFLKSIVEPETIPILQEMVGFCLYKDYFIHKWFLLYGAGRNGKGAWIRLMENLLGKYNCKNIVLQKLEEDTFSIAELHGKLANFGGDIPNRKLIDTGNIKQITGGDSVSAQRKFLSSLNFRPYAKQIHSCNNIPDVDDISDGFFDRIMLIIFPYKFVEKSEYEKAKNKSKLRIKNDLIENEIKTPDELSGFLNFALEGLSRLLKNRNFSYSRSCDDVKSEFLRKADSVYAFFQDCCNKNTSEYVSKEEFREKYAQYCDEYGLIIKNDKDLHKTLITKLGLTSKRITLTTNPHRDNDENMKFDRVNCWCGVEFKKNVKGV